MSQIKIKTDYIPAAILAFFVALIALFGFIPVSAGAEEPNYRPWLNGSSSSAEGWQANVDPWNKQDSENIGSGCIVNGRPLSEEEKSIFTQILNAAGQVYNNRFGTGEEGTIPIDDPDKLKKAEESRGLKEDQFFEKNGGFPSGPEGYRQFIAQEKRLLKAMTWLPYDLRQVVGEGEKIGKNDYAVPNGTYVATTIDPKTGELQVEKKSGNLFTAVGTAATAFGLGTIASGGNIFVGAGAAGIGLGTLAYQAFWGNDEDKIDIDKKQKRLATFIPNGDNPLETAFKLPIGCTLPIKSFPPPQAKQLIDDPINFVVGVLTGVIDMVLDPVYKMVKDRAWQWTFMTPHTERGDLLWELPTNCANDAPKKSKTTLKDACSGGEFLGFSKERLTLKNQKAPFLKMGHFSQWIISGFYFIIFFTMIAFFIVRGTKSRTLNVMTILPRLLLSIVLTLFATFIIGAIISFANFLVISIIGSSSSWDVGAMNVMLTQPDLVMGGMDLGGGLVVKLLVKIMVTYFYILFVFAAIIRQLALVIVVILAPVAIFCIINPSWQPQFNRWLRTLLAIAFIPVILAFILKVALIINPAIQSPEATYGSAGLGIFSIIMLMLTLWAMARVIRSSRNFILGQSSMVSGAMGSAGDKLSAWGANRGGRLGKLAERSGRNLSTAGENSAALGQMVPSDKVLGGGYAGLAAAGGGGAAGALRAGLGGSIAPTNSTLPGKMEAFQARRMADFNASNTLKETSDHAGFYQAEKSMSENLSRSSSDMHGIVDKTKRPQFIIARRDAIVSAAMSSGLGGLPVKQNGRFYVETDREKATQVVHNMLDIDNVIAEAEREQGERSSPS